MFVGSIVLKIKDECKRRNISINKLAKLSNIPQSTLNSIMNGCSINPGVITIMNGCSINPGVITIKNICEGLNISLGEFFHDDIFN